MRNLAVLLGKTEQELHQNIGKLEQMCGFPSEDVRIMAESKSQLRHKLGQLGLDPDDTTGPELYHALLAKYDKDAATVDRVLGVSVQTSSEQKLDKVCQLLDHTLHLRQTWVLKSTVAKQLLAANPPKKLMKSLGYRSVDSFLKREDIAAALLAAEQIESASWQKRMQSKIHKLPSTNFELRTPQVVKLSSKLPSMEAGVVVSQLAGAAAMWPNSYDMPTLTMALMLADGLAQIGEQQERLSLDPAHIALKWWTDAEHLVFDDNGQPVSLNFKDIATNHLQAHAYGQHSNQNGHQAMWAQLMERYKNYIDELPQEIESVPQKAGVITQQLAMEPAEIYE